MSQTLNSREDPLNLGGGWASSNPFRTWSSSHQRRRGASIYKRRHRYGPKAEYEPPRKQLKQQHGPGPWFQPPQHPYWAVCSNWGPWGGPCHPPPAGFRRACGRAQMIRVYGLHPLCLCCCSCWHGSRTPGWPKPCGWKRRWGRRGRGLRRPPRRSFGRSPPGALRRRLRPANLQGWRAPGMRAPRNTTQFIMNQIYEDMRQQKKLEREKAALRAQHGREGGPASPEATSGDNAPPSGEEEDPVLQEILYGFVQNPSPGFRPNPEKENQSPTTHQVEEEEEEKNDEEDECEEEVCDEKESEEEDEEGEGEDGEEEGEDGEEADRGEVEEADSEDEAGGEEVEEEDVEEMEDDEPREEENDLPLGMPLSILVGSEEERENFMYYNYFSPKQTNRQVPQETPFMVQDINC